MEFVLDSKAKPLGCYVAMHCSEDTQEAPEQFCRYFFSLAPSDSARLRNCFTVAAAGR